MGEKLANEIASFLITFRESLEAALIIVIIIAYITRIRRLDLKKYVWFGSITAIATSIIIGIAVLLFFGGLTGLHEKLFEGIAALTATVVLTYMIFWMARNARKIKGEIEEKIDFAVTTGSAAGIVILAYIAVVREGIETVLFLTAIAGINPSGVAIGGVTGVVAVFVLAIGIMKGIYHLDLRMFFKVTSIVLIIFAAGLLGFGVHELIEAGEIVGINIGVLGQQAYNINPPDVSNIFHEKGSVGVILKSLIGYDGNPEILRVIVYLAYWFTVGAYLLKTYQSVTSSKSIKTEAKKIKVIYRQ